MLAAGVNDCFPGPEGEAIKPSRKVVWGKSLAATRHVERISLASSSLCLCQLGAERCRGPNRIWPLIHESF